MSSNPFSNKERQHFPEWSPMFTKTNTPSSSETLFRWSIDQLARLKPVNIATSPGTLANTNITSPENNLDAQAEAEKFFSQKCIQPSPWLNVKTQTKHVTFTPLPSSTAFYKKVDVCTTTDASTQTILTIPMDLDLEKLLGHAFYTGDDSSFSLRRKLFGKPQRDLSEGSDDEEEEINQSMESSQRRWSHDTQLSSTPLRSSSSPAVTITRGIDVGDTPPPLASSFLYDNSETHPDLSPIGSFDEGVFPVKTPSKSPHDVSLGFSPIKSPDVCDTNTPIGNTRSGEIKPTSTPNYLKSVLKRQFNGSSEASPRLKHQRVYHSEHNSSSESEDTPAIISLGDLQTDTSSSLPTTCTTYFTNMGLDEGEEKPLHSLVTTWQPNTHSTMLEHQRPPIKSSGPSIDSGLDDLLTGHESHDNHVNPTDKLVKKEFKEVPGTSIESSGCHDNSSCDSGIIPNPNSDHANEKTTPIIAVKNPRVLSYSSASLLPSRIKINNLSSHIHTPYMGVTYDTPPSRYTNTSLCGDPLSRDLIRRKSLLKAKLNFTSPVKYSDSSLLTRSPLSSLTTRPPSYTLFGRTHYNLLNISPKLDK